MDTSENVAWVTSMGGPLILIPESACPLWRGAPSTYPDVEGDYGRAGKVEGYTGLIDVGPSKALVLTCPARTTYLPAHGLLIQEIAGGKDDETIAAALNELPAVAWQSPLSWEVREPLMLFDSVYDYSELAAEGEEHLRIELAPERYTVESSYRRIPGTAHLVLVRLAAR